MTSWNAQTQHKRSTYTSQCVISWLVASLLLLATVVTSQSPDKCTDSVNINGVNGLNCARREIDTIPTQISETTQVLDFSWNRFTELPWIPESMECMNKTCPLDNSTYHCRQNVSFSRNQISKLASNALRDLRCLRTLDLSYNKIKGDLLHSYTFQEGGYHLQRLLLNNNPLGSLPGNVITAPFMPGLIELDLSHCDLDTIDPNAVDDFSELKILNLSFNRLKAIHSDTFKGLDKLEYLNLRENQLTSFPEHIFGDLGNLQVLILSDNYIESFHENAFYSDSSLQALDLRNNRLTSVPYTALNKVTKLQTLDLSQNPIRQVNRGPINLSSVKRLVLDNMPELAELRPYALASFPALVSLSISGNKELAIINRKFLGDDLASLKRIRLENNKLASLKSDVLPWKQLEELKVGGNPWYCDDRLEWMIRAAGIENEITCAEPLLLKGRSIKSLNPDDLARDYSLQSATGIIILCVCLPIFGVCAVLVWRRRRHCPCVKVTLQGRYVTLFSREMDEEGEQRVAIELKVNANKLNSVSNGGADDSVPFIRLHKNPDSFREEDEFDI